MFNTTYYVCLSICRYAFRCAALVMVIMFVVCFLPLYSVFSRIQKHIDTSHMYKYKNNFPKQNSFNIDDTVLDQENSTYGYVIVMDYCGQQGAGIQALISLQCFIGSFNLPMKILEPVITSTKFESYYNRDNHSSSIAFSDMFDIVHFNSVSRSDGLASLAPKEEFMEHAPKAVILVIVAKHPSPNIQYKGVNNIWSSQTTSLCYQSDNTSLSLNIVSSAKLLIQDGFCIKQVVSVVVSQKVGKTSEVFNENTVYDTIFGRFHPQNVTLILSEWRAPWYASNSNLKNPRQCKDMKVKSKKAQFHPSSRLLADVKFYQDHYLNSSNSLAIMLRLERMLLKLRHEQNIENHIQNCLNEVTKIASHIWKRKGQRGVPLVTTQLEPACKILKILCTDLVCKTCIVHARFLYTQGK